MFMRQICKVGNITFIGDHLPRKCGIATFRSDLLAAIAAHPQSQCFSVSVKDIKGGYDYLEVVRFEAMPKLCAPWPEFSEALGRAPLDDDFIGNHKGGQEAYSEAAHRHKGTRFSRRLE